MIFEGDMRRPLLCSMIFVLAGCLSVCPDARDREAKERLFSMEEPSMLEQAAAESIDATQVAANEDVRRRVLWMTAEETSARLGSFLAETEVSFDWRRNGNRVRLGEKAVLELSESGDYRVTINNDRDFGMELRWIGETSYVKSRQGTFRERRADRAGHEEWREEALSQLQTLLELASGRVRLARTGTGTHEGRQIVRYAMTHVADPDPAAAPPGRPSWARDPIYPSDGPDKALRYRLAAFEQSEPLRITGDIWIDEASATIVHADLSAVIQVSLHEESGKQPARLDLSIRRTLRDIGRPRTIDVPEHRPFERRPRAIKDPLDWWPPYVAEREKAKKDEQ